MEKTVATATQKGMAMQMALMLAILGRPVEQCQYAPTEQKKIEYPDIDEAIAYIEDGKEFQGELLGLEDLVSQSEQNDPDLKEYWESRWDHMKQQESHTLGGQMVFEGMMM